jgi:hypothetical protein
VAAGIERLTAGHTRCFIVDIRGRQQASREPADVQPFSRSLRPRGRDGAPERRAPSSAPNALLGAGPLPAGHLLLTRYRQSALATTLPARKTPPTSWSSWFA